LFPALTADLKKSPLEVTEALYKIVANGPLFKVPAKAKIAKKPKVKALV
jgi:hypothetical protein